jgi:antitoxin (DNA-binding transcriptional repressor) of toxin-antitoxin stability system
MKTATVRELRNEFSKLEAWLSDGQEIRIEKRGHIIGVLRPPGQVNENSPIKKPDFMARLHETWGGRVFTEEEVRAMREDELEGEEG